LLLKSKNKTFDFYFSAAIIVRHTKNHGEYMPVKVKTKLLSDDAETPRMAHLGDSGYDIKMISVKKIVNDVIFFGTGVSIQPTQNYYFEVVPRSSISKLPLSLANSVGIIDNQYTGEIIIPIRVHHTEQGNIKSPDTLIVSGLVNIFERKLTSMRSVADAILKHKPKMCQLILRKRLTADFIDDTLEETERSDEGFGSTDK